VLLGGFKGQDAIFQWPQEALNNSYNSYNCNCNYNTKSVSYFNYAPRQEPTNQSASWHCSGTVPEQLKPLFQFQVAELFQNSVARVENAGYLEYSWARRSSEKG